MFCPNCGGPLEAQADNCYQCYNNSNEGCGMEEDDLLDYGYEVDPYDSDYAVPATY